jgi:hypothetical protein
MLIKSKVKLHQFPDVARQCVEECICCVVCSRGGSVESRETGEGGKPGWLILEIASRKSRQIAERGKIKDAADTYHMYAKRCMCGEVSDGECSTRRPDEQAAAWFARLW